MRYLSLFSGIEACTVAWKPLGWEAVAFSEWDAAPSAVLAHHYPGVPNFGDVSKITADDIRGMGHIDLVVGGSPCQNLSLAGNGKGLSGEKSQLFFEQIRIFHLCRRIHGTRFLLWENVPGARSTNKGADFARVVAEMAGLDNVTTPKYGWGTEGAALGDHGLLEWGCLDSQFRGLAQRRKRVFALLDTGDWTSRPPILLERESLRGDSPPSREAQQEITTDVRDGVAVSGGSHWDDPRNPHPTLNQSHNSGGIASSNQELFSQRGGGLVYELLGGVDYENNGFTADNPCGPLMAGSPTGGGRPLPAVVFEPGATSRGLGKRWSTEVAPYVESEHGDNLPAVAFSAGNSAKAHSIALSVECTPPLRAASSGTNQVPTVAYGIKATAIGRKPENGGNGLGISEEVCDTLTTADRHGVAIHEPVVMSSGQANATISEGVSPALTCLHEAPIVTQHYEAYQHHTWRPSDITGTLTANMKRGVCGDPPLVVEEGRKWPADLACTLNAAFGSKLGLEDQHINGGAPLFTYTPNDPPGIVRRLTPKECCRLQGFPDDYLDIEYRGKPFADGNKYKALGNSMAVPVMRYIGEQIQSSLTS